MPKQLIELSSGAESIIYINSSENIVKDRIVKNYRIPEIDIPLRKFRTKRESKVISTLNTLGLAVPKLLNQTDTVLEMEYIDGAQLKKAP